MGQRTLVRMADGVEPPRRQAWALGLLAGMLLAACLFFAFYLPQTPGRMARSSAALIPKLVVWAEVAALRLPGLHDTDAVALLLLGFAALSFAAYALALGLVWRHGGERRSTLAIAAGGALALTLVSAFAMPTFNTDIYNYIVSGRVGAEYGENPHYVSPDAFPEDPIYPYASAQYTDIAGDNKLPVWTLFNVALALLAGDRVVGSLLAYRFGLLLVHAANAALIVAILRRLVPRYQATGLICYAWNPIVALQATSKADTLMVFFLLLTVAALVFGQRRWVAVPLALSVLVKLITLPLALLYAVRTARERAWARLAVDALLALAVTALVYLPFIRSPGLLRDHLALLGVGGSALPGPVEPLAALGFGALIVALGWTASDTTPRLLRSWALVMLYFGLFLTRLSLAWYLMVLIALVSVAIDWRLLVVTLALSFSGFLVYTWSTTSNAAFPLPDLFSARLAVYYALPTLILLALALPIVRRAWRERMRAAGSGG